MDMSIAAMVSRLQARGPWAMGCADYSMSFGQRLTRFSFPLMRTL